MSFTKLFESLDKNVFTPELKKSLEAKFNEAVETKSQALSEERIEEEIDSLNEKSEAHINLLNKKAEEFVELKQEEILESVDKYLDRIVEEFVTDAKDSLDESVKSEKSDLLIEAFDAMIIAGGVELSNIVEAKDETSIDHKLTESVNKYDVLVEENISLKSENEQLIKLGIISELKEGLSIVESTKFEKLAELVEFTQDEQFLANLEVIKENVKSVTENTETILDENEEKPDWQRFV